MSSVCARAERGGRSRELSNNKDDTCASDYRGCHRIWISLSAINRKAIYVGFMAGICIHKAPLSTDTFKSALRIHLYNENECRKYNSHLRVVFEFSHR